MGSTRVVTFSAGGFSLTDNIPLFFFFLTITPTSKQQYWTALRVKAAGCPPINHLTCRYHSS